MNVTTLDPASLLAAIFAGAGAAKLLRPIDSVAETLGTGFTTSSAV